MRQSSGSWASAPESGLRSVLLKPEKTGRSLWRLEDGKAVVALMKMPVFSFSSAYLTLRPFVKRNCLASIQIPKMTGKVPIPPMLEISDGIYATYSESADDRPSRSSRASLAVSFTLRS
jgi:hypothetical protein